VELEIEEVLELFPGCAARATSAKNAKPAIATDPIV
jgi:hypothetical protein